MKKPKTKTEFRALIKTHKAKPAGLLKYGFRWWDDDKKIMLIPGDLHGVIPEGYPVGNLNNESTKFSKKKIHADDLAFGCLPVGVIIKPIPTAAPGKLRILRNKRAAKRK